jgi:predicted metalloendopeptidase
MCVFFKEQVRCSDLVCSRKEAEMSAPRVILCLLLLLMLSLAMLGQNVFPNAASNATSGAAAETKAPQLEHFDASLTDQTLNPCDDFYKYSCNKWLRANPIPADQVYWSTGSSLELWNENLLRETLEASSKNDASRSPVQRKIGDYWAACTDESGIEAAGLKPLQAELDRIAAIQSKKEITCFPAPGSSRTIRRTLRFSDSPGSRTMTTLRW